MSVLSDSSEILDLLVNAGLEFNDQNAKWPILIYVCRGDTGEHPERVKRLLEYGVDVNVRGLHNFTALHAAARAGFNQVVKVLLDNGTNVSPVNDAGKTPFDLAYAAHKYDTIALLHNYGITA